MLRLEKGSRRVVLIDSDESFRNLASRQLPYRGIAVRPASNAREGLVHAHSFGPDLIQIDSSLSECDAELRRLRSDPSIAGVPIVLLTSDEEHQRPKCGLPLGVDGMVCKSEVHDFLLRCQRPGAPGGLPAAKVLIMEDDETSAELAQAILKDHQTRVARDGVEGLLWVRQWQPAVIVLDLGLPKMNGVDVFRALRSDASTRAVPVIIATAMDENLGALSALLQTLGAPAALHKPLVPGDLLAAVNRALLEPPPSKAEPCALSVGRLAIDPVRRKVWVSGVERNVVGKRFDLLHALASRGSAMTLDELLAKTWPGKDNVEVVTKTLQRLREDLRLHDAIVVSPSGYRLVG